MISDNEFFREVTLRICGSLEIEEGLHSCYEYLAQHIPMDKLYLERHEPDLSGVRVIAEADAAGGRRINVSVPLPADLRTALVEAEDSLLSEHFSGIEVINRPEEHPLGKYLLQALGEPMSSYMGLPLILDDRFVGGLGAIARGNDRYNDDHAHLFSILKEPFFVAMSNALRHEEVIRLTDRLADDNRQLQKELLHISGDEIIGADFGLREVMRQVQQVASTESPVLVTGETGVGKDVIANAIHLGSPRRDGPFIPVNCGAIANSLIDSELFGHEKGAFTGALSRKRGRFERADKGTILLDEIGDMPMEAQVRLLRVIQHREIERIGGTDRIPVDIRIIAATNQDLQKMVQDGRFREDLFFRLNVFPIKVPPLRDRNSDIPALVQFFTEKKTRELKLSEIPRLAPGAIDVLLAYGWPGNVRELENVIERAMILHRGESLQFGDLGRLATATPACIGTGAENETMDLDAVVARHIRKALRMSGGKIHGPDGAGELLGVNPNTLRYRMRKLGIVFRKQKGSS
jgi:transcriptional regulator with GAF, ATPase, and Fis domain